MSETPIELTEQDEADLAAMQGEATKSLNHTLLEIWRDVLSNVEKSAAEKVTPYTANKIVGSWPQLKFQDVPEYHRLYHTYLLLYRDALDAIIKAHPGCLSNIGEEGTEEFDPVANRQAYIDIFFEWQMVTIRLEHLWDAADENSHVVLAALADAAALTTGEQGLIQHLSQPQINFQFDEADQMALSERLAEARSEL